jgi:hypothetical protein
VEAGGTVADPLAGARVPLAGERAAVEWTGRGAIVKRHCGGGSHLSELAGRWMPARLPPPSLFPFPLIKNVFYSGYIRS